MAKSTKAQAADAEGGHQNAIARYALERAAGVVSKLGERELAPGSYPFALTVDIAGELLVGNPSPGSPATPPGPPYLAATISASEIVVGLIGSLPESEQERVVSEAMGAWKSANETRRAELATRADAVILKAAKRRKLVEERREPGKPATAGRRGAVQCKPSVTITGTAGSQQVSVEVAAD